MDEPDAPDIDEDVVLVLDDIRLDDNAAITSDFGNMHDHSHAGRLGNVILTNGQMQHARKVQQHQRLRLRLINTANARIFRLGLSGLTGWIMALDGMPLDAPTKVPESFLLAPAQRMDLFVDVTAESGDTAFLVQIEGEDGFSMADFEVVGQASASLRSADSPCARCGPHTKQPGSGCAATGNVWPAARSASSKPGTAMSASCGRAGRAAPTRTSAS